MADGIFDVRPSIPQGWPLYYYMNNVAQRPKALNEFARIERAADAAVSNYAMGVEYARFCFLKGVSADIFQAVIAAARAGDRGKLPGWADLERGAVAEFRRLAAIGEGGTA